MLAQRSRAQSLLVLLLVASTVAFVAGVALERRGASDRQTVTSVIGASHVESDATGETGNEAVPSVAGVTTNETHTAASRVRIFGISPESLGAVSLAVIISMLLGIGLWLRRSPALLAAVLAFGLLFAALDILEALHQADEDHTGLLVLALTIAVLHLLVAAVAALALRPAGTAQIAHFAPASYRAAG